MILNEALLRQLIIRELLWPTGTERREITTHEQQVAEIRANAVLARYTNESRKAAYKDVGGAFHDDRHRRR